MGEADVEVNVGGLQMGWEVEGCLLEHYWSSGEVKGRRHFRTLAPLGSGDCSSQCTSSLRGVT